MIFYENSIGKKINLEQWPIVIQEKENLFQNKWKYESKNIMDNGGKIIRMYKEVAEISATLSIFADSEKEYQEIMDNFLKVTEYDIYSLEPGRIWVGDYYLKCYIFESEYSEYEENFYAVEKKVNIVTECPIWMKENKKEFRPGTIANPGENLDYPVNYPYDYTNSLSNQKVLNDSISACDFEMIIYGAGACINPSIRIGEHQYNVECEVDAGEYLVINSRERRIFKKKINGDVENCFHLRNREYYVFEKIPAGIFNVIWNGLYGFDIVLFEERGEPKWI